MKNDIEKLIEVLAYKCHHEAFTTSRGLFKGLICKNIHCQSEFNNGDEMPVRIFKDTPILIGDCLAKMEATGIPGKNLCGVDILIAWRPCGFTNSFQQIIEESGWESVMKTGMGGREYSKKLSLKPPAKALAEFLIKIFL